MQPQAPPQRFDSGSPRSSSTRRMVGLVPVGLAVVVLVALTPVFQIDDFRVARWVSAIGLAVVTALLAAGALIASTARRGGANTPMTLAFAVLAGAATISYSITAYLYFAGGVSIRFSDNWRLGVSNVLYIMWMILLSAMLIAGFSSTLRGVPCALLATAYVIPSAWRQLSVAIAEQTSALIANLVYTAIVIAIVTLTTAVGVLVGRAPPAN